MAVKQTTRMPAVVMNMTAELRAEEFRNTSFCYIISTTLPDGYTLNAKFCDYFLPEIPF